MASSGLGAARTGWHQEPPKSEGKVREAEGEGLEAEGTRVVSDGPGGTLSINRERVALTEGSYGIRLNTLRKTCSAIR